MEYLIKVWKKKECLSLNDLHKVCLRYMYPFLYTWGKRQSEVTFLVYANNMTARLKTGHTLHSTERKLASLPSDPVLDFSPFFPSFFLLFPDDNELADLLFAFSFKEMFCLTGCEVDPGAAPSCSNSRSTKTT